MSDSKRIRVAQMIRTFDVEAGGGGLTRFALELGQRLDPERFEVIFCSLGYYSTPLGHQWITKLEEQGYWAFEANPKWNEHKPYMRFFRAVDNMRKSFWRSPVHILHSHSEFTDVAAILLKPSLPAVHLIRTIQYGYPKEWRHRPSLRTLLTNFAYPLMMETEVGVNQAIADRLNRRFFARLRQRNAQCIYNAVSLERFADGFPDRTLHAPPGRAHDESLSEIKTALGIPPDAPVIGSVGRLTEQKAYHILLQAAPIVLAAFPDAYFLIVGGGDLETQLHQQARQMGLEQRCIFTGVRQDIEDLLPCMDIFVSTSLWEGLPTVIMEAMACNIPVIASDIPGTNELVQHDHNGWLTSPADPVELASAIQDFLTDPDLGQRLAQNARQTVEGFTIGAIAQTYENLYIRMMDYSGGSIAI